MSKFFKKVGSVLSYPFRKVGYDIVGTWKGIKNEKITPKIFFLVIINVVALLISNIIAARAFEFGFIDGGIRFALPIAMLIYPIVITISDVLADTDYIWTRRSCHIGFILNLFMVGIFEIAIAATGGRNGDFGILSNTWYLLIASVISFYFGDLANDLVFKKLKDKEGEGKGKLVKRCILSTILGQFIDATIFVVLGMHLLPLLCGEVSLMSSFTNGHIITSIADPIGWANVGIMIGLQIFAKVLYEFALAPLIIWLCNKFKKGKSIKEIQE